MADVPNDVALILFALAYVPIATLLGNDPPRPAFADLPIATDELLFAFAD